MYILLNCLLQRIPISKTYMVICIMTTPKRQSQNISDIKMGIMSNQNLSGTA